MTIELVSFCGIYGVLIIIAYTLGLKNGQKLVKKEEITLPNINPVNVINKQKEIKEQKKEQEVLDIMMANIDNYDGSGIGQKDIPS